MAYNTFVEHQSKQLPTNNLDHNSARDGTGRRDGGGRTDIVSPLREMDGYGVRMMFFFFLWCFRTPVVRYDRPPIPRLRAQGARAEGSHFFSCSS